MTGATILGCAGTRLSAEEARFFADAQPFGFILFARNLENPQQVAALVAELRTAVGWHAPVFIDQEGGRVQRMGPPHWHGFPPPLEDTAGRSPQQAARMIRLRMRLIASDLTSSGIDGNCAPLADIAFPETHPILRNRCYGHDMETVTLAARACADALLAGGVLPVVKHIPGHGRATVDSHLATPTLTAPLTELRATDFAPFRALADLPLGMTGHLVIPEVDPDRPVTISPKGIDLIRQEIGFDGLLMTDDLSMEALGGTPAIRAANARAAGCDVILHCNGDLAEMQAVVAAAGTFDAVSQTRADRALAMRTPPQPVDIAALRAELEALRSAVT